MVLCKNLSQLRGRSKRARLLRYVAESVLGESLLLLMTHKTIMKQQDLLYKVSSCCRLSPPPSDACVVASAALVRAGRLLPRRLLHASPWWRCLCTFPTLLLGSVFVSNPLQKGFTSRAGPTQEQEEPEEGSSSLSLITRRAAGPQHSATPSLTAW